jgi:hypothetical protein
VAEAAEVPKELTATNLVAGISPLPLSTNEEQDDQAFILGALDKHSGSQEKFRKRWIEFDCLKGVHHGKYATYENGKRIRVKGGYLGRFDKVKASGSYGEKRVYEFAAKHNCHYPERFYKDLDECGVSRIEVEGWPSGRSISGLPGGGRHSGSEERGV